MESLKSNKKYKVILGRLYIFQKTASQIKPTDGIRRWLQARILSGYLQTLGKMTGRGIFVFFSKPGRVEERRYNIFVERKSSSYRCLFRNT